jgi:hypothetical protein
MSIGECLHDSTDETGNGDKKKRWLTALVIGKGTREESSANGTSLHGSDKITGKISACLIRTIVKAKLSREISVQRFAARNIYATNRWKSGMARTPPIIPASTPKRAPAKHAEAVKAITRQL